MKLKIINGCWVDHDIRIVLPRIGGEIRVATAYLIAPFANGFYFTTASKHFGQAGFIRFIGEPDGVIKVKNNFFTENFRNRIFDDGRSERGCFAVDENIVEGTQLK